MKRYLSVGVAAVVIATALALFAVAPAGVGGAAKPAQDTYPQPDTSSPDWKPLSDDLGIWIGKSDRVGWRGRLYARVGDSWVPVAIDGAADIQGVLPAR